MKKVILSIVTAVFLLSGCASWKQASREERAGVGAQIGAFVGWLFGWAVGDAIDSDIGGDIGAFVGTAVGGVAGAQIAANTGEVEVEKRVPERNTVTYVLLPALEIEDILLEEDSATQNSRIDAGEQCRIALLIVNNSFQEALDVEPVVQIEQGQKLQLSEPVKIARVTRDERVTYRVTVQAPADLRTGEVLFSVYLKEKYGNGTAKETFRVPTSGR